MDDEINIPLFRSLVMRNLNIMVMQSSFPLKDVNHSFERDSDDREEGNRDRIKLCL
jgi:hypothetical protein